MLAVALNLKLDLGSLTELAWQRETLLEILIRIFCDKLTEAVRKGMPRRYVEQEDDLSALRGRVDVARQFTRHVVNPSRLACRFDVLSEDTSLNRIMKAAVVHLSRMSRSSGNQQRLRELCHRSVQRFGADPEPFDHLFDRVTAFSDLRHSVDLELI